MLPVYLLVIRLLPDRWTDRQRRLAAIGASPLLLLLFGVALGAFVFSTGAGLFVFALPGAVSYGFVVRLRRDSRPAASILQMTDS